MTPDDVRAAELSMQIMRNSALAAMRKLRPAIYFTAVSAALNAIFVITIALADGPFWYMVVPVMTWLLYVAVAAALMAVGNRVGEIINPRIRPLRSYGRKFLR